MRQPLKPLSKSRPTDWRGHQSDVHRCQRWVYGVRERPTLLCPVERATAQTEQRQRDDKQTAHPSSDTTVGSRRNQGPLRYGTLRGLMLILCVFGCEASPELPSFKERPKALPLPTASALTARTSAPPTPRLALRPETERAITKLRNETLRFTPREAPLERLSFFGAHVARLTRDALYLALAPQRTKELTKDPTWTTKRIAIDAGRELVRLADDGLLVVTASTTLVFDADGRAQSPLGKVPYFPGMHLWSERRFPKAFSTFESSSATHSLYRWEAPGTAPKPSVSSLLLPQTVSTLDGLAGSLCGPLIDGSFACVNEGVLYTAWPGYAPKRLGPLEPGATIVRVLSGDRLDRIRVLRSDGRLEEYWPIAKPKRLSTLALPWVPFDVARLEHAVAVLRLEQDGTSEVRFSLAVVDTSGKLRWAVPLGHVPTPNSTADFDRDVLDCRSLATHPSKPWIAVSDCETVQLFDARTGTRLGRLESLRF